MNKFIFASLLMATFSASCIAGVERYPLPNNSTFPIARAVEVPAATNLIYHSGQIPSPEKPEAEKGSREYYGDTYTQSMSVFKKFEASFKDLGVDFGDAVKLTVFLVGDPKMDGKMDFDGFMKAYTQFFGTKEQPNLPARSAIQIAGLAGGPGMLVEIEMVLAKPVAMRKDKVKMEKMKKDKM
ncbi:RutC family protein [Thalassocella blandensis]|nr:RutC family protein [Thalassocella blandensis]